MPSLFGEDIRCRAQPSVAECGDVREKSKAGRRPRGESVRIRNLAAGFELLDVVR